MNPIEIDGSFGEGGGAILRIASALAAVTGKSVHIFNIRKSRPKGGGLGIQHLKGLEAITKLCNGRLENAEIGSKEIWLYPEQIQAKDLHIKIETAGSITLVLQTLIPPALFAQKPIEIYFEGGATDTFFSPTIDHFRFVFLKILEKMEAKVEIEILKRGYYPSGGGKLIAKIFPTKLKSINLTERGEFEKILIISGASEFLKNKRVSERQLMGTREILKKLKLPIEEKIEYYPTSCPGSSICIVSKFENTLLGMDGLGKLGKPAEQVGRECALELLKEGKSNVCLDRYMGDQILIYLALTGKISKVSVSQITEHIKTNIWVIQQFLNGKFEIKDNLITWEPD